MQEVTEITTAQSHIRGIAKFFEGSGQGVPVPYQLLTKHGVEMAPPQQSYPNPGKAGECFYNAYQLLRNSKGWLYCEGYAIPADTGVPLEHAWMVDVDGYVIDPTWNHGTSYFGMAFSSQFVTEVTTRIGYYGIIPNLYMLKMSPYDAIKYLRHGILKTSPVGLVTRSKYIHDPL